MMKIDDDDWLIVMMIFDDDGVVFDGDCKVDDDDWLLTPSLPYPEQCLVWITLPIRHNPKCSSG